MNDVKSQLSANDPGFESAKLKAKDLYMKSTAITQIAEECNLGLNTLKSWIYGQGKNKSGWLQEREMLQTTVLRELTADKAAKLKDTANMTVDLIYGYVSNLINSKEPIDLKTAERLSSMLTNLNKVISFDKEHLEHAGEEAKPSSPDEIRRKLDADPFSRSTEDKPLDEAKSV
jgi:hypothetical protein